VPILWHDSSWRLKIIVTPTIAVFNRLNVANSRRTKQARTVWPAVPSISLSSWRALCRQLRLTRASFMNGREAASLQMLRDRCSRAFRSGGLASAPGAVSLGRELLALAALPLRSLPPSRLQIRHLFQTTGCCL